MVALRRLGRIGYARAHALQRELVARRRAGAIPDTLLLLEHEPVFTLGRLQASRRNVLAAPDAIAAAGASVVQSDRGGNVTFHGPGQLVAYPILDLGGFRKDLRWHARRQARSALRPPWPSRGRLRRYISALEETMIASSAAFGVQAARARARLGHALPKAACASGAGAWSDRRDRRVGWRPEDWRDRHHRQAMGHLARHRAQCRRGPALLLDDRPVRAPARRTHRVRAAERERTPRRCGLEQSPQVTSLSEEAAPARRVTVDDLCPHFEAAFARAFDRPLQSEAAGDAWVDEIVAGEPHAPHARASPDPACHERPDSVSETMIGPRGDAGPARRGE